MTGIKHCKNYVGVSCVDGSCPIANAEEREEREERCMDVIRKCKDCWMYKGCEDCGLNGTEYCEETEKAGEQNG